MSAETTRRRVVLVGLGPTTLAALEGLVEKFDVVALIRNVRDTTTERADSLGVPVRTDASLPAVRASILELQPDAVVVSSFDRILDAGLVEQCPFVNVHFAPLPRGRGRATVNWAIINGDDEAAISIHRLMAGLDSGAILYQATVPITLESTVTSLYADLNELQRTHLATAVGAAIAGDPGVAQDESQATYFCTRVPDDGEIDWSSSTARIDRLVRALQDPFPPAFTWLGLERLEVIASTPVQGAPVYEGRVPGRVVQVDRARGSVDVLTADGVLRLLRVRPEGLTEVDAAEALKSVRLTLGLRLADVVAALHSPQRGLLP